jgi:hypothetical protein
VHLPVELSQDRHHSPGKIVHLSLLAVYVVLGANRVQGCTPGAMIDASAKYLV